MAHLYLVYLLKVVIFYIYLSLPEGNLQNVADVSRVQRQPN